MRRPLALETLAWGVLIATLGVLGWMLIASTFMTYDDEGYVLYSARMFGEGHPLYTEVFSQYGPAFYLFYRTLGALTGLEFTHDAGRMFTLGYWLASALSLGLLTRRLGASMTAAWFACAAGYVVMVKNINEPFHPGALIALTTILAAWLGAECLLANRPRRMAVIVAALGAILILIKINVGVFLLCAWGAWWLRDSLAGRPAARPTAWILALLIVLVPAVLMRAHLDTTWGAAFALTFAFSALTTGTQIWRSSAGEEKTAFRADWTLVLLGIVGLVVAIMAALGTSPAALWEGVVAAPLRHPKVYAFPAPSTSWSACVTALSLLGSLMMFRMRDQRWRQGLIIGARLASLAGFTYAATRAAGWTTLSGYVFTWGPASVVWLLTPLTEHDSGRIRARWWVAWVFLWQLLHAYPVAGSQLGWGSALWIVLAALGADEIGTLLRNHWRPAPVLIRSALAVVAIQTIRPIVTNARLWWNDSMPLAIEGASSIKPPPAIAKALNVINENLAIEAGAVATMPGMLSFNLWSGRPSPIVANTTHWFSLLNEQRQREAVAALENDPRAILVFHRDLIDFLARDDIRPSGPLSDYLRKSFTPAVRLGPYDVCVKIGRLIRGYGTFKERGGQITGWVRRTSPPSSVFLRSPTTPDWDGVRLSDATWTEEEPGNWRIVAIAPADWPAHLARELVVEGPVPQRVLENHAPVP